VADYGSHETVEVRIKDKILWVALNRPDVRNAFNEVMIRELLGVLARAKDDDGIRLVVLTFIG
jgi:enoyl-CoA hydratase/carnithine racemase